MAAASIGGSESADDEREAVGEASRRPPLLWSSPRPPDRWRARTATRSADDISQRKRERARERGACRRREVKDLFFRCRTEKEVEHFFRSPRHTQKKKAERASERKRKKLERRRRRLFSISFTRKNAQRSRHGWRRRHWRRDGDQARGERLQRDGKGASELIGERKKISVA